MLSYHKTSENSKKASRPFDRRSKTKTKSRRRQKTKTKRNREIQPRDKLGQRFLRLFEADSDNFDCIIAEVPNSGKPEWKTEKYPLEPVNFWSIYQEPTELVGKRFNSETSYGLFDLDIGSKYNPNNDSEAYSKLIETLRKIGINKTILIQSSFNGGYHLYFFLPKPISTYSLAVTLKLKLETADFQIKNGQLEIFPNTKQYLKNGFSKYQAHRMPLQAGSFFLNKLGDWSNNLEEFIKKAEESKEEQDINKLKKACKYYYKKWQKLQWRQKNNMKRFGQSNLENWELDLREQISQGFTGKSQTNDLLKTIAKYGIIFENKSKQDLVNYIVKTIISLPGYHKYCDHQSNIKERAKDWARCAEKMYVPSQKKPTQEDIAQHRGIFRSRYSETMNSDIFDKNHRIKTQYATKKEEETRNRIIDVLLICQRKGKKYPNFKTFLTDVNLISKEKYGIGTGYDTLQKYKAYWSVLVVSDTQANTTNTHNPTGNNNTKSNNSKTLEKLIFSGSITLQNTTSTQNQEIQQHEKSSSQNSQTQDVEGNTTTPGVNNVEKKLDSSNSTVVSDSTMKPPKSKVTSQNRFIDGRRWGGESEKADKFTGDSKTNKPQAIRAQKINRRPKKEYSESLLSSELLNKLKELEIPLDSQLIKRLSESSQYTIDGALLRFKQVRRSKIKNPAAWLMQALTDGYQPHELRYSNITKTDNQTVETADPEKQSPQPQSAREAWDGKLKITPEFLSFWENAKAIPGFLKPNQEINNLMPSNDFYEPKVYISTKLIFIGGKEGEWYLCDWTEAQTYLSKNQPAIEETNPNQNKPKNTGTGVNSQDFLRFWDMACQTPGFLRPGQTLLNLLDDGYGEPRVSISEEIAAKYLPPRSESARKNLLKFDPDGVNWRLCDWKQAQRYLEDLLDF